MRFFDSETAGLTGPIILLQWADDEGEVKMLHTWKRPMQEFLDWVEETVTLEVCAFNLVFDWYQVVKDYNVYREMIRRGADPTKPPQRDDYVAAQKSATPGVMLRPVAALDLYLFALRGPMQSIMDRNDVRIRKVPRPLAEPLARELDARVKLEDIFFHHRQGKRWTVHEIEDEPHFCDVVLHFAPSAALKPLVGYIFGIDTVEYPIPSELMPRDKKIGWDIFNNLWVPKLMGLVHYWSTDPTALRYAREDVEHLQRLYKHWGCPRPGDDDSELTVAVANTRWRGVAVDAEKAKTIGQQKLREMDEAPRYWTDVLAGLKERTDPIERLAIEDTSKETLEAITRWGDDHPAAQFAKDVIKARTAERHMTVMAKLVKLGGSFHPDYKVIGTKSFRMSGAGGLNAQGIPNEPEIRSCFTIVREPGYSASGGDAVSYEVTLMDAVYQDPELHKLLISGKKIHAIIGEVAGFGSYDDVMESKHEGADSAYDKAKRSVFAFAYGAQERKLSQTLEKTLEDAEEFLKAMYRRFPTMMEKRQLTTRRFETMRQPGGIGTRIEWHEPADYIESFLGDRRYFTLENEVCRALFDLAQKPPPHFRLLGDFPVKRRDRVQTAAGAVMSALFSAAFQLQASNTRAAGNHEIQSPGGRITKAIQRAVWDLQPVGIHRCHVSLMNSHDELMVEHLDELTDRVEEVLQSQIQKFRAYVPLLQMEWMKRIESWAVLK